MAEKARSKTPTKPLARSGKAKGGRPTRAEALRRRIAAVGVDPALVDPLRILAGIAVDESAPHAARVSACKAMMAAFSRLVPVSVPQPVEDEKAPELDALTVRALSLMAGRGGLQ